MSRYAHQKRPCPVGMATAIEYGELRQHEARYIRGFLPGRYGTLYSSHLLRLTNRQDADSGIGLLYYSDARRTQMEQARGMEDRSRIVSVNTVMVSVYAIRFPYSRTVPQLRKLGWQFLPRPYQYECFDLSVVPDDVDAISVRGVQYKDELFFCLAPGSRIYRFVQDADGNWDVFLCGIDPPSESALSVARHPSWIGTKADQEGLDLALQYDYRLCWADEKKRLSSPSETVSLPGNRPPYTRTPDTTDAALITITWPEDRQVKYAVVCRAAQGTNTYYQIIPRDMDTTYIPRPRTRTTTIMDTMWEAQLVASELGPMPGENDPPAIASHLAIYRNRLWATDSRWAQIVNGQPDYSDQEAMSRLQVSNLDAPTQFSSISDPDDPSLGTTLVIGGPYGDRIEAIGTIGSMLGVWKRNTFWYVSGTSPLDFHVEYGADVTCINGSTLAFIRGVPYWLGADGVYTLVSGLTPVNIGLRVANLFGGPQVLARGSVEANE